MKTKRNRKWKIPYTVLERRNLCFSSYKSRKLKEKLWWIGARKGKKKAFFVPFILSEETFLNICVLCQCIAQWIHFQDIHTFTYQKTLLNTLLLLLFKVVESLQMAFRPFELEFFLVVHPYWPVFCDKLLVPQGFF